MTPSLPPIYFVRHGETDWNAARRYQGQADIPLNDKGRAQARRNGETLRGLMPQIAQSAFVASPLQRTQETMRIVRATMGLEPDDFHTEPRLVELHYGRWQGQLLADLPRLDPDGVAARAADPFNWRPPGGENYVDLQRRIATWLPDLTRPCVLVSHGGVSRALRGMLVNGIEPEHVPHLEVPQDRVLLIEDGKIRWL